MELSSQSGDISCYETAVNDLISTIKKVSRVLTDYQIIEMTKDILKKMGKERIRNKRRDYGHDYEDEGAEQWN